MTKRVFTYSTIAALAVALVVPAIAFSQAGPRDQGSAWAPRQFAPMGFAGTEPLVQQRFRGRQGVAPRGRESRARGPQGFNRGQGRGDNRGARGRGGPGREFAGRGRGRGGVTGAGFGAGGRSSLAARALARADTLGLTADQEQQIREVQRAHQQASIERRAASQAGQLDMRDLMSAETKDVTAIEAKLRELSELQIGAQTSSLYLEQAVGEVLTAEQVEELDDQPGRGRDGRRGGRGPIGDARREAIL